MPDRFEVNETEFFEPSQTQSRINPFRLAWCHRWLLLLGAVSGCIVGALYYSRATPIYQSSAQVLVVKKSPDALPITNGETRSTYTDDYLSTHQTLIRSPVIVGAAVKQANLASLPSFAGSGDPTGEIIASLKVSREMNGGSATSILNISFRCSAAEDAAKVVAAAIESYQKFLSARYKNVADETANLIVQANEILEQKLTKKQKEYDDFIVKQPAFWRGKDGVSAVQERLSSLEGKRSALFLQEAELQGRLMSLDKALKDGRYSRAELFAMIVQMPGRSGGKETTGVLSMEERLMALKLQEKTLLEDYGADHPQVRSVRDQLAMFRARMKRSDEKSETDDNAGVDPVKTHIQSLKLELENTRMAAETLGKLLQAEYRKAEPLRSFEKRDESYRTEIARSQQLFDAVAKRLDEVSILKNFAGGYDAETIAPASVGMKVAPKPLIVFASALMMGLLAGFGLAYLAELSDHSFRTPEEIRRQLGLPVVGHIPFFEAGDNEKLLPADGPRIDPILSSLYHPMSREAEAYRSVRTALYFNSREGGHTVIQVTSPDMGDGKTTLIANLAVSIAQSEKKIILIDADFRRPRLHKLFKLSAKQGLASVMSGDAEINDVVQPTPIPGLFVLPCGPIPPNPAELLTLPRFEELLAYLREKYDFVLIDTPPLLAVTDPCVVVPHVDGVILTVRISKNARPHATRAKEILATLGANVIGVVVNGVGADAKGYGYQGYRYGYGDKYYDYTAASETDGEADSLANGTERKVEKKKGRSRRQSWKKKGYLAWLFDR